MSRRVNITKSTIPGPFNLLDLPDGQSIEFVAVGFVEGTVIRQIFEMGRREEREGPILRVYTDLKTPVFGAPYLDILSGRTIAMLKAIFNSVGLPVKLKLTARGQEPSKWYEVSYEVVRPESE